MPLYVYECPECSRLFEHILPSVERLKQVCPNCQKEAQLKVSTVNWSFGWRLTDRCHEVGGPQNEVERDI